MGKYSMIKGHTITLILQGRKNRYSYFIVNINT